MDGRAPGGAPVDGLMATACLGGRGEVLTGDAVVPVFSLARLQDEGKDDDQGQGSAIFLHVDSRGFFFN